MKFPAPALAISLFVFTSVHAAPPQGGGQMIVEERGFPRLRGHYTPTPTIRPALLAEYIDVFAGQTVRVTSARVVGVFEPNVFLIDTKAELYPVAGHRARVLVLIQNGALRASPTLLVGSTVTISGVARTLLGMQMTTEVPWPPTLTPERLAKLEIKAAILAQSLTTPDGVELTTRASARDR